ncbi:MAG: polysaccharide biosynthesis C-terminal domain-containing protein [Actinobacteria bacterium]|nr:polysaccharide biosynthesis C-terminal domain-containing protein [Actinomycetota bacterium]
MSQAVVVLLYSSIVGLAMVTSAGAIFGALVTRRALKKQFSYIDIRLTNARMRVARSLLASGSRNGLVAVCAMAAFQSDVIVVSAFLGSTSLAAYGVAVRASTTVRSLSLRATDMLVPTFAHSGAKREDARTRAAIVESIFLTRAILILALILLLAFGSPLLHLWLGAVPRGANMVLVLFVLGAIISAPGYTCFVFLTGMDRLGLILVGTVSAAVANLSLSALFTWKFGIIGPVLGSIIAWTVWDMLILPRRVASEFHIPWLPTSFGGFRDLSLPATAGALAGLAVVELLDWRSPSQALPGMFLVTIIYLGTASVTIGRERRQRYGTLARGIAGRSTRGTGDEL